MIAGYCWPQSAGVGESVALHCSTNASSIAIQVVRVGAQETVVHERSGIAVFRQAVPDDAAASGCGWTSCAELAVADDWASGFYLVRMLDDQGQGAETFFVVRAAAPTDALLVLSTSTWAAYNNWGGPSYYTGGNTSSLQRPLPRGFLAKDDPARHRIARFGDRSEEDAKDFERYSPWCMAAGWANWEVLFVRWAEARGVRLGYATSQDLDHDQDLLTGYPAYISVGHDEYWTTGMRDQVERYIDGGGNAAFFSGNTAFWHARLEDQGSTLVCYKNAIEADPHYDPVRAPKLSTMWSDPLLGRPESLMTGVSFTRGGYAHMPSAPRGTGGYRVERPEHWAFESVAPDRMAALGADGIVVGYECDGCELVEHDGQVVAKPGDSTPEGFLVLATAPARLWETSEAPGGLHESYIGELNWVAERLGGGDTPDNRARFEDGHAVMGTFRRGNGEVFTTGCTDWAYGLVHADVSTVTANVLSRFIGRDI